MININKPCFDEDDAIMLNEALYKSYDFNFCENFEISLKEYFNVPYAVVTSSGTTALMTALKALGVKKNDKVLTTPFTFIATTNAIRYCDAVPVFADIDPLTFNIMPESIENILQKEPEIKYMIIAHLFGQSCNMKKIVEIAKKYKVILIEDCAQAIGATWDGTYVGSFGEISTFSFNKTKNITTMEGGAIFMRDKSIYDDCRYYINHGMENDKFISLGYNYRMTALSAAIGISQLKKLRKYNEIRACVASRYNVLESESLIVPQVRENDCHTFSQYTLRVLDGRRNELKSYLNKNNIDARIYYQKILTDNLHLKKYFKYETPNALQASNEVLSLPIGVHLSEDEINTVIKTVNDFYQHSI